MAIMRASCYAGVVRGMRSQSRISAPHCACSARLRTASRTLPGGSVFASSRSRAAWLARRSSRGCVGGIGFPFCTVLRLYSSKTGARLRYAGYNIAPAISSTRKIGSKTGGTSHSRKLNEESFAISTAFGSGGSTVALSHRW